MAKKLISIDDSKTGEAALPEAVNTALRNTYGRSSINASEFGFGPSATPQANRTALQEAVNAAIAKRCDLFLPERSPLGAWAQVAGTVNVTGSLRIFGAGVDKCRIHQTQKPAPVFYVTGTDVWFDGFMFSGDGLDMTGLVGPQNFQYYVGIHAVTSAHGLRLTNLRGKDIYCVALLRGPADVNPPVRMKRFFAADIEGDLVWSAIHGGPFEDATLTRVRGSYRKAFSTDGIDTGQKPHLIYLGSNLIDTAPDGIWTDAWRSKGVKVTDCQAYDAPHTGSAFALKHIDGLDAANLSSRNCPGPLELLGTADSRVVGVMSIDDTYPSAGEESGRAGLSFHTCRRTVVEQVTVSFKAGLQHGRAVYLESTSSDCKVKDLQVVTRRPTADTNLYDVVLSGYGNVIENPTVRNLGAKIGAAIRVVGTGARGQVINPRVAGQFNHAVRVEANHKGAAVEYDPLFVRSAPVSVGAGASAVLRDRSIGQPVAPGGVDSLDRDNADSLGTTDDGKPWFIRDVNTNVSGWGISGNRAKYNGGSIRSLALFDAKAANGTLRVTIGSISTAVGGIALRAQDANNYLAVLFRQSVGVNRMQLIGRVAGASPTQYGVTAADKLSADGAVIEVVLAGNQVSVRLNGVEVITPKTVDDFVGLTAFGFIGDSADQNVTFEDIEFIPA